MTDRIRLLVEHDRNRDLLAEWLADRYEVHAGAGEGAVEATDLCVLDEAGFERHRERVTDWKNRADPVFAPVLLVAEGSYDDLDPETWESVDGLYVVDDIVVAPVEQALLHRRLENLLSRRELSTDLADSYRRSQERFASLFHAMPDPALVLSEGHVTYVNDAFCDQYGVDRDDTNWRRLDELAPLPPETVETIEAQVGRAAERIDATDGADRADAAPDSTDGTEKAVGPDGTETPGTRANETRSGGGASAARTNRTGKTASADDRDSETAPATDANWGDDTETVVVETADGEERYVETNVRPLTVDERRSVALVMRDVTERRERKRTLERQNERLEEFASIVSHDLRNPLQVLSGRLQAIEAEREADRDVSLDDHVPAMGRSVDRMRTLIDDLLTLARGGETLTDPTSVSLATAAGTAWETTDAPDADLHVRTGRSVLGDDSRIRQIFENLFRNAVEHGSTSPGSQTRQDAVEHGGEDVTIVVDDLEDCAGFFVADDGPGIPPEERDAVLDMGYTNSDDGTGIGLGIVTEIATAHGWDVELTESKDGGARFEFHGIDS